MKKRIFSVIFGLVLLLGLVMAVPAGADKPNNDGCTTIQDGVLTYSAGHYLAGEPLQVGYDPFGYNYQGHMFKGSYANSYLGKDGFPPYEGDTESYLAENPGAASKWYWPYRDVQLMMKWSDVWLSNKDCSPTDGKLDRGGPGGTSSAAEGSWLTNHQSGTNEDGTHWVYFVKIVYPPGGAVDANEDGIDDNTGGSVIWGSYVRVQQVSNDPALDEHGLLFIVRPAGFGAYK